MNSALTAAFSGAQSFVEGEKPYHTKIIVAASLRDRLPNPPGEAMGYYALGVELKLKYDHKKSFWENARRFHRKIKPKFTNRNLFEQVLTWLHMDSNIYEAMNFKKLGGLVPSDSTRYEKLSAFSKEVDVVARLLKRVKMDSLDTKICGAGVTNLGRMDFPKTYGALELDRLIFRPGGGFTMSHFNLVLAR